MLSVNSIPFSGYYLSFSFSFSSHSLLSFLSFVHGPSQIVSLRESLSPFEMELEMAQRESSLIFPTSAPTSLQNSHLLPIRNRHSSGKVLTTCLYSESFIPFFSFLPFLMKLRGTMTILCESVWIVINTLHSSVSRSSVCFWWSGTKITSIHLLHKTRNKRLRVRKRGGSEKKHSCNKKPHYLSRSIKRGMEIGVRVGHR